MMQQSMTPAEAIAKMRQEWEVVRGGDPDPMAGWALRHVDQLLDVAEAAANHKGIHHTDAYKDCPLCATLQRLADVAGIAK